MDFELLNSKSISINKKGERKMKNTNITSSKAYKMILQNINNVSNEELLAMEGYYDLLKQINVSNLDNETIDIELNIYSSNNNDTASTNNETIRLNTYSPLVLKVEDMYNYLHSPNIESWAKQLPEINDVRRCQYLSNIGSISHEDGHILYTNFKEYNFWLNRVSWGDFNKCANKEKLEKLYNSQFKPLLIDCCKNLANVIEDGYIENCLMLDYPEKGSVVKGLTIGNAVKFFLSEDCRKIEEAIVHGDVTLPSYYIPLLQLKILGYTPKYWNDCKGLAHDIMVDALNKSESLLNDYINSNKNHSKDFWALVDIMSTLFPDPESQEKSEKKNSKESGNQNNQSCKENSNNDSNSSSTEQQKQDFIDCQKMNSMEKENETMQSSGMTAEPVGMGEAKKQAKGNQKEIDMIKTNSKNNLESGTESMIKMLASTINANNEQQKQLDSLNSDFNSDEFKGRYCKIDDVVQIPVTSKNKREYIAISSQYKSLIDSCVRKINQILDKREYDEEESGLIIGTKFNANQSYRKDKGVFSKKLEPDAMPDVCFSIMIDQSYSMDGEKIREAKKVAILLTDIAKKLQIPVQVIGHSATGGRVMTYSYVNYNSKQGEEYSLGDIDCMHANMDAVVLNGLCTNIMRRSEEKKVVIVISDGCPHIHSHDKNFKGLDVQYDKFARYHNGEAMAYLNTVVRYYRKKGIKIIGVSLDDYEYIKAIYEQGTLDCSGANLKNLPNALLKIFKSYVLR